MQAVGRQNHQHQEVRNHDGQIKRVELVQSAERIPVRVRKPWTSSSKTDFAATDARKAQ